MLLCHFLGPLALSPSTPLILSLSKDEPRSGQACRRARKSGLWRSWFDRLTTSGMAGIAKVTKLYKDLLAGS